MTDDVMVTRQDLRALKKGRRLGVCQGQAREWFAAHGLEWGMFLRRGMKASVLEASGDARAIEAARIARARAANG